MSYDNGKHKIYNIDDKEGFEINPTSTVVIVRVTVRFKKSYSFYWF